MLKAIFSKYAVYIIYFLGVGMTSSGIVLMPFNPLRYGIILAMGLVLFSTGSYINEVLIEKKELALSARIRLIVVSLTLAIGIGMISGGIAHFKESPIYVSYLIPIGVFVSFVSFWLKNDYRLTKNEAKAAVLITLLISFTLHYGLGIAASYAINGPQGGDIFKQHGM